MSAIAVSGNEGKGGLSIPGSWKRGDDPEESPRHRSAAWDSERGRKRARDDHNSQQGARSGYENSNGARPRQDSRTRESRTGNGHSSGGAHGLVAHGRGDNGRGSGGADNAPALVPAPAPAPPQRAFADDATKTRNKRLFGALLLGHLGAARERLDKDKPLLQRQNSLEQAAASRLRDDAERLRVNRRDTMREERERELRRLDEVDAEVEKTKLALRSAAWAASQEPFRHFILTKRTAPALAWRPNAHTDRTQRLQDEAARAVDARLRRRREADAARVAEIDDAVHDKAARRAERAGVGNGGGIGGGRGSGSGGGGGGGGGGGAGRYCRNRDGGNSADSGGGSSAAAAAAPLPILRGLIVVAQRPTNGGEEGAAEDIKAAANDGDGNSARGGGGEGNDTASDRDDGGGDAKEHDSADNAREHKTSGTGSGEDGASGQINRSGSGDAGSGHGSGDGDVAEERKAADDTQEFEQAGAGSGKGYDDDGATGNGGDAGGDNGSDGNGRDEAADKGEAAHDDGAVLMPMDAENGVAKNVGAGGGVDAGSGDGD